MCYNAIIIGTALNYSEKIDGEHIYSMLPSLKDSVDDIIGLNCCIMDDYLRLICTKFLTIDCYTCEYLSWYPWLQDKMYIDKTVKKEADRRGTLKEVKNIFQVSKIIETDLLNDKLYLNPYAPTVLQTALNLALKKGLEKGFNKKDINVYLLGISLDNNWKHHNEKIYVISCKKDDRTINDMRMSTYKFMDYLNLYTFNTQHTLHIKYKDPRSIKF